MGILMFRRLDAASAERMKLYRGILSGWPLAMILLCGSTARAQSDSLLTRVLSDTTSLLENRYETSSRVNASRPQVGSIRFASASGGFLFGIVLGGFAGYEMASQDCTNCRNSTADGLLLGATIGGTLGAALGAAFLDLGSKCTFEGRIARTFAGALAGATASHFASGGVNKRGRAAFFIPIGAIGGSLAPLGRCWKSRF